MEYSDIEDMYNMALNLQGKGEYSSAIDIYTKVIKIDPLNFESIYRRSQCKNALKDFDGSYIDLKQADIIGSNLEQGLDYYEKAGHYYDTNEYKLAIEAYDVAIGLLPMFSDAYYNRGIAKEAFLEYKGAIWDFTLSIELDANNKIDSLYRRGMLFLFQFANKSKAHSDFCEAIAIDSSKGEFYYYRSKCQSGDKVLNDLLKAEDLGYKESGLYFDLLSYYLEFDQYEKSLESIDKYISLSPKDGKMKMSIAHFRRGFINVILQKYDVAILDFDKSIEYENEFADVYYWRGYSKKMSALDHESEQDFTRAFKLGYKEK